MTLLELLYSPLGLLRMRPWDVGAAGQAATAMATVTVWSKKCVELRRGQPGRWLVDR